ncbi:MAG: hypothetical protein H6Q69_1532 [Firmicutes bacterium]|nr:hypothetical protein [Bacillota bacterium]
MSDTETVTTDTEVIASITDTTANTIISTAAAASANSVSDALFSAADTVISAAETSAVTDITKWVEKEIAELRAEIKNTTSFAVAARDKMEILLLEGSAIVALVKAKKLFSKLKSRL